MKDVSSGVIYTDGTHFLLGHATGTSHWDIPKGKVELNETPLDAVIREAKEETGLTLDPIRLIDLGLMKYRRKKDLHLWKYIDVLPPISTISCSSTFTNRFGQQVPEFNKFKYVTMDSAVVMVSKSLIPILETVIL